MKYGDLISVVIPVYNRAHNIARCVGSMCTQSYANLEILVVDDCSTDDIAGAVAAIDDPRVRLVQRATNGGASAARNSGVQAAKGDVVAFMDSDDISMFDRFAVSMRMLCDLPDDYIGVYCAAITHTDTKEDAHGQSTAAALPPAHVTTLSGDVFDQTLQGNFMNMPTMLLKKSAVLAAGPFDARLRNNVDWDFTLRLTQQGKFGFVSQPMCLFSYVPRIATSNDHISDNPRYSVRSYAVITGKLRRSGHTGPALAKHYTVTGNFLMRLDRPARARTYFWAAQKITPLNPKLLAHLALSYVPTLHKWVRTGITRPH